MAVALVERVVRRKIVAAVVAASIESRASDHLTSWWLAFVVVAVVAVGIGKYSNPIFSLVRVARSRYASLFLSESSQGWRGLLLVRVMSLDIPLQ